MHELNAPVPDPGGRERHPRHGDGLVGRTFNGRFRIESRLARGGMGKVYRAVQVPLGRTVALKVLNATLTEKDRDAFHRRFFLEAATAARLSHPHTVTIFDYGCSDDGIYYIAMEYLEGLSLRQALQREGPLAPHRAIAIAIQMARALREAHALGFMHRDLKPANVMLLRDDDGRDFVKVLDFGLAKSLHAGDDLTRTGQFLGSPGYMSPEQIRGHALDGRCDIYALGALLFEMLTGRTPFPRPGPMETLMAHVHEPVPTFAEARPGLQLPATLEAAVQACLCKAPADRPADMSTVMARLREAAGELTPAPVGRGGRRLNEYEASGWAVISPTGALKQAALTASAQGPAAEPGQVGTAVGAHADSWATTVLGTLALDSVDAPTLAWQGVVPNTDSPSSEAATRLLPLQDLPPALYAYAPRPAKPGYAPATGPSEQVPPRPSARLRLATVILAMALGRGPQPTLPPAPCLLHIDSRPVGAQVSLHGTVLCASTPCTVRYQPEVGEASLCLHFEHAGYESHVVSRRLTPWKQVFRASLAMLPDARPEGTTTAEAVLGKKDTQNP
jgi:hypothetical protein